MNINPVVEGVLFVVIALLWVSSTVPLDTHPSSPKGHLTFQNSHQISSSLILCTFTGTASGSGSGKSGKSGGGSGKSGKSGGSSDDDGGSWGTDGWEGSDDGKWEASGSGSGKSGKSGGGSGSGKSGKSAFVLFYQLNSAHTNHRRFINRETLIF